MFSVEPRPHLDLQAIETVLDALLRSENASEFCRALVHSELTESDIQGCQMYLLDNSSLLSPVAGYGVALQAEQAEITAWDESPIAVSVRTKTFVFTTVEQPVIAIPLLRDGVPVGCLCLVLANSVTVLPVNERLIPILAKLGTYCLTNMAIALNNAGARREPSGDDLTSRQVKILEMLAEGMVNAEIALKLMVSESTVRQETVRIYRALGVPNRLEAAKRGRQLGLIRRPPLDQ